MDDKRLKWAVCIVSIIAIGRVVLDGQMCPE